MSDDSELYGRYYNKKEEDKFWRDLERQEIRKEALAEGFELKDSYKNKLNLYLLCMKSNMI